jgi:hypothetical protein
LFVLFVGVEHHHKKRAEDRDGSDSKAHGSLKRTGAVPRTGDGRSKASSAHKQAESVTGSEDDDDDEEEDEDASPAKKKPSKEIIDDEPIQYEVFEKSSSLGKFLASRTLFHAQFQRAFLKHGGSKPVMNKVEKNYQKLASSSDREDLEYPRKKKAFTDLSDKCAAHLKAILAWKKDKDPLALQQAALHDMELLEDSSAEFQEVATTMEQMRTQCTQQSTKLYRQEYNKTLTLISKLAKAGVDEKLAKVLAADMNVYNSGSKALNK